MGKKILLFLMIITLFIPYQTIAKKTPVEEKVAVLITGWGLPDGFNLDYAWNAALNSIGDKTEYPGQPCKIGHVGSFPFQSHMNMQPFAVLHQVSGFEKYYDGYGYYKLVDGVYVGAYPDIDSVLPEDIPAEVPVVALVDLFSRGKQKFPPDPNTGEDHLAGWYKIGDWTNTFPNGASDFQEEYVPVFIRNYATIGGPTEEPASALPPAGVQEMDEHVEDLLHHAFRDKIDVRSGFYTAVPGYTLDEEDVAEEFAHEGFRKMLMCRETTDNNRFANVFATGNYVKERLCEIGVLDDMEIQQTRQVGRTPEFNTMNVINLQPYIEAYPEGSTIGIIYVTRGLPFDPATGGPFGRAHPWLNEIYHDNAYLNYLSWKKAVSDAYGDRYTLVYTVGGVESNLREDNFYTYGIDIPAPFKSIRDAIQEAKADGLDKLLVAPCHWNYDNTDTILRMREINGLKVNTLAELDAEIHHTVYCEDTDGAFVNCDGAEAAEITIAPAYLHLPYEFAVSYYVALRGGIERFGVFPKKPKVKVKASGFITKLDGGIVEVTDPDSKYLGAKIEIPADPYPDRPESFTGDNATAVNDPLDTNDCMWEDSMMYIGKQNKVGGLGHGIKARSKAVYFGPYRTLFNRDVTLTLPLKKKVKNPENVSAYIYNDLLEDWEEVPLESLDVEGKRATLKTKVLGVFRIGEKMEADDCDDEDDDD